MADHPHATWVAFREQAFARSRLDRIAPVGSPTRVGYLALGLCGETGEAVYAATHADTREGALSELGDVAWYLAMMERESGVWMPPDTFVFYMPNGRAAVHNVLSRMMMSACACAEVIKRPVQGRDLNREALDMGMRGVTSEMITLAYKLGSTLREVLSINIAKNHARFGAEGFSVERQRELDAAQNGGDRG